MSLIQVSSQSKREENQREQQSGYRFSNAFNGVLEIPPYSEVALHSGQFCIDTGAGSVDFVNIGGDSGNQDPAMRMMFAPAQNNYYTDWEKSIITNQEITEYTANSTTNPFLSLAPRKKYKDVSVFWKDMVDILRLDPRPQLQATYSADGSLASGLSVVSSLSNAVIQPTFNLTRTPKADATPITAEVFKTKVTGGRAITLSPLTGNIIQTTGASGRGVVASLFYTQSSGIHNDGGSLSVEKFIVPSPTTALTITTSNLIIGLKRWGFDSEAQGRSDGWANMSWSAGFEVPPTLEEQYAIPYQLGKMIFDTKLYGLQPECICDFAFQITNKVDALGANGGKQGIGFDPSRFCCNILKYEKGGMINQVDLPPRYFIIATGDPFISTTFRIPYSKELDPESDLETWTGVDLVVASPLAEGAGGQIIVTGNKVTFELNGQVVNTAPAVASEEFSVLSDYLSDVVYPLQVSGTIFKKDNGFGGVKITPVATQREVPYYGKSNDDMVNYISNRSIIPAEILNINFDENSSPYLASFPTDTTEHRTPVSFTDLTAYKLFMFLGETQAGNARGGREGLPQPNIQSKVGSKDPVLVFTGDTANYDVDKIRNPMLNGLYVRLKNLPHKTTMGSINSVDNDKLIGIVNRYDHTDDEENLTSFPIYSFSEYDRLYIALNNPAPMYLSSLDFEIVDKFGTPMTPIQNTTLTLHLRPATYKDLYGYRSKL
jgi:hypothetical protein